MENVIWLTGLSGSGKSTLGLMLKAYCDSINRKVKILDGDEIRNGINSDLSFSINDRKENIRRVSHLARILAESEVLTICCFITPTNELRDLARTIIGDSMKEIYLNASVQTCEQRDVKGLYEKARKGIIADFTGVSSPFERSLTADLEIDTENDSKESSLAALKNYLKQERIIS